MKKIISVVLLLVLFTSLTGCSFSESKTENEKCGGKAPTLIWDDQEFVAPYMPKNELPEGYEYIGTLTKENAADTGLEGCKIYAEKSDDSLDEFYVYQECGTPIDNGTLDTTQLQWAYVQWIKCK